MKRNLLFGFALIVGANAWGMNNNSAKGIPTVTIRAAYHAKVVVGQMGLDNRPVEIYTDPHSVVEINGSTIREQHDNAMNKDMYGSYVTESEAFHQEINTNKKNIFDSIDKKDTTLFDKTLNKYIAGINKRVKTFSSEENVENCWLDSQKFAVFHGVHVAVTNDLKSFDDKIITEMENLPDENAVKEEVVKKKKFAATGGVSSVILTAATAGIYFCSPFSTDNNVVVAVYTGATAIVAALFGLNTWRSAVAYPEEQKKIAKDFEIMQTSLGTAKKIEFLSAEQISKGRQFAQQQSKNSSSRTNRFSRSNSPNNETASN